MGGPLTAKYSVQLGFSFDTHLGDNLSILKAAVLNQDFDAALIVDGKEGAGKSVFGMQIAHFLDIENNIDLDLQVCFTPDAFKKAIDTLKPGKAIVWDEARRGLNRRRFGQEVNLSITDMLAECRQHNLFLIIIMPSFYDMDLNVAIHRTRALIHVYYTWGDDPNKPLQRGYFRFYNEDAKSELYADKYLRQRYQYPYLRNKSFDGVFSQHYVVNEVEYKRRKRLAEKDYQKDANKQTGIIDENLQKRVRGEMLKYLISQQLLLDGSFARIADYYGVARTTLYSWIKLYDDNPFKKTRRDYPLGESVGPSMGTDELRELER